MEQARRENLVVCLPTGSGKTYIAVMLIKEMADAIRARVDDGGKRTIFLVKTGLSFNSFIHAPL
jgi:endoribonuclease Dicer